PRSWECRGFDGQRRGVMSLLAHNPGTWRLGWLVLGGLLFCGPAIQAADTEAREFACLIDGKRAGDYKLTLARQDDGTVTATLQAEMRVTKFGVTVWHYSYRGTEVWKNGRLQRLESNCDDDGKKYTVNVVAEANGLKVNVNGQEHTSPADAWLTSFWQLPGAAYRNAPVALLEGDNGKDIKGHLQMLGTAQVSAAGQVMNCTRARVTSTVPHELWYDAQERIVRQEWTEDGHKVILELTRLQR